MTLVSVITATYNMAHFIDAAINSVLKQTYKDIEYIIIDDGSTDNTKKIVSTYLNDSRIRYIYQRNQGQTIAKNHGLKLSQGEYICFLDADNIWELNKVAIQLSAFEKLTPNFKILYTLQQRIDGKGEKIFTPTRKRYSGKITDKLLFDNFITFNTVMVKRECFEKLGYFNEELPRSPDYELWLRFSTRFDFYYLPEFTVYYRVWEGQMSQEQDTRFKYATKIMDDFIKSNPALIESKSIKNAWNYTFTNWGRYKASIHQYFKAVKHFMTALKYDPISKYTWKSILRMLILWK